MAEAKISIIIPSYNHSRYVIQAIESVLTQDWSNIDLIVIDDGSTDGSPDLIRRYHEKRGGFRFIARENRGLLKTLNEGLGLAEGEFFCELASDDYFPPDSIRTRACFLRDHPECIAVFADGVIVVDGKVVEQSFLDDKRRNLLLSKDPIPDMLKGVLPVFSTGLIRRNVLQAIGGFDDKTFRYYEDLDTPLLLAIGGRLDFIDAKVICRRHHATNVSHFTNYVRAEKVFCYHKLLFDDRFFTYRKIIKKRLRRSLLALARYINRIKHLSEFEKDAIRIGWRYSLSDIRLIFLMFKNYHKYIK